MKASGEFLYNLLSSECYLAGRVYSKSQSGDVKHILYASAVIKSFVKVQSVNGLLPRRSELGTAKDDSSRLRHEINKLFFSLWLVLSVVPVRTILLQGICSSGSYLGHVCLSPWRIFRLNLMGEFTCIFRLASLHTEVTQRPIHA